MPILTWSKKVTRTGDLLGANVELTISKLCCCRAQLFATQGLHHASLPCPSPPPGICSDSCLLSQWCHPHTCPLSTPSSPAFNLSQHQGLFQGASSCIRYPKYWSFSFSISPSNEYSELISFRINWFDFLAVQSNLKSLLQHHSSKASILLRSALFMVHFSHPYITNGKTITLTRWTFVGKVMSAF